jgi:hypothetical protein
MTGRFDIFAIGLIQGNQSTIEIDGLMGAAECWNSGSIEFAPC